MTVKQLIDKLLALNPAGDCEIAINGNYFWDWSSVDEDEIILSSENTLDWSSNQPVICIGKKEY